VKDLGNACRQQGDDLVVSVRVTPRARHNTVSGVINGALHIRTTAPPADGKANKAVIGLLAGFLDVPQSSVSLLRGQTRRDKSFLVKNGANKL
jgi:uncharacterized protein (TIGR00251 family)